MNLTISKITSFLSAALVAVGFFLLPTSVKAQEEVICTVVYGQGEVCGVTTEEPVLGVHEPIEAGVEDVNFLAVAAAMGAAGAFFFLLSKLTKRIYLLD
jgi:hypothetical protein